MAGKLIEIFTDKNLVEKIKKRLPYLFQLAELESSWAGKTGMEVGSVRERIIVALLIYKLGGVKLIWTVDAQKAIEFRENYYPSCDILLVQINWGDTGGFFYIPVKLQIKLFEKMGNRF